MIVFAVRSAGKHAVHVTTEQEETLLQPVGQFLRVVRAQTTAAAAASHCVDKYWLPLSASLLCGVRDRHPSSSVIHQQWDSGAFELSVTNLLPKILLHNNFFGAEFF